MTERWQTTQEEETAVILDGLQSQYEKAMEYTEFYKEIRKWSLVLSVACASIAGGVEVSTRQWGTEQEIYSIISVAALGAAAAASYFKNAKHNKAFVTWRLICEIETEEQ